MKKLIAQIATIAILLVVPFATQARANICGCEDNIVGGSLRDSSCVVFDREFSCNGMVLYSYQEWTCF